MPRPLTRWLKSLTARTTAPIRRDRNAPARPRLGLEPLEDRSVPAVHTWIGAAGGNWNVSGNWTGGIPTSGESGGTQVVFNGNTSSVQNIAGLTVDSIFFAGGSNSVALNQSLGLSGTNTGITQIGTDGNNGNVINGAASLDLTGAADPFLNVIGSLTIATRLTGSRGFTKAASGTLTLTSTADSTYSGTTLITSGTLVVSTNTNNAGLGASTNIVVGDGNFASTLRVTSATGEINDAATVTVNGLGRFEVAASAAEDFANLALNSNGVADIGAGGVLGIFTGGTVSADGASTGGQITGAGRLAMEPNGSITFNVSNGAATNDLTVATFITGQGTAGITKTGTGTLQLTSATASTYSGGTTVNDGVLLLNTTTNNGGLGAGNVTVGDGTGSAGSAVLRINQNFQIINGATITVAGDGLVDVLSSEDVANLTLNGGRIDIANGRNFFVANTVATTGSGSQITGTGNFVLDDSLGSGTVTFDIANGPAASDLVIATPIIDFNDTGTLVKTGAGTLELTTGAASTYSGTTTVADGVLLLNTVTDNAGLGTGNVVVGDGTGAAGSAVLRLNTSNELIDTGTLTVNADGRVEVTAANSEAVTNLTLNGGTLDTGTGAGVAILDGGTVTADGTPGSAITGTATLGLFGAVTFAVGNGTAASDLTIAAPISSVGSLTKTGAGTLVLNGTNTYTGATTVSAGTLAVNGSLNAVSAVAVNTGGTLAGTGTVGGTTVNASGTVSPAGAGAAGTLTTGALAVSGTFVAEFSGAGADQISASSVNLTGATLTTASLTTPTAQTYTLINNTGGSAVTGTFNGLAQGATLTIGGAQYTLSYVGGTGNDVVLTLVPAPPTPPAPPAPPTAPTAPPPFYSGATSVPSPAGSLVTVTGAGVAGGSQTFTLPTGSFAFFLDANSDGKGDVVLLLGGNIFVFDGATGRFFLGFADFNGDGRQELMMF